MLVYMFKSLHQLNGLGVIAIVLLSLVFSTNSQIAIENKKFKELLTKSILKPFTQKITSLALNINQKLMNANS